MEKKEESELQVRVSKSILGGRKGLKMHEPIPEHKGKSFQMDDYGNFRIAINSSKGQIESDWVTYEEIATINIGNGLFIGVSDHYNGRLPTERLLRVEEIDEDGESNFYKFKIADLVEDRVLCPKEIDEILRDPPFDVEEYGFVVVSSSRKDFVKVKIIQFGNTDEQDRCLSKEEVVDYIIDTFPAVDFDVYNEENNIIEIDR